jgi:hypothetical protein
MIRRRCATAAPPQATAALRPSGRGRAACTPSHGAMRGGTRGARARRKKWSLWTVIHLNLASTDALSCRRIKREEGRNDVA